VASCEPQLAGRQQPHQPLRVTPIGLDTVTRRARHFSHRHNPHIDPTVNRYTRQTEPGRPGLVDRLDRTTPPARNSTTSIGGIRSFTRRSSPVPLSRIAAHVCAACTSRPTSEILRFMVGTSQS
jgi:hypothetical protein